MKTHVVPVACCGERHRIAIAEDGSSFELLDHDVEAELVAEQFGAERCECVWLHQDWHRGYQARVLIILLGRPVLMAEAALDWAEHALPYADSEYEYKLREAAHALRSALEAGREKALRRVQNIVHGCARQFMAATAAGEYVGPILATENVIEAMCDALAAVEQVTLPEASLERRVIEMASERAALAAFWDEPLPDDRYSSIAWERRQVLAKQRAAAERAWQTQRALELIAKGK